MNLRYVTLAIIVAIVLGVVFFFEFTPLGQAYTSGECTINAYGLPQCDTFQKALPKSRGKGVVVNNLYSCDLTKPTGNAQTEGIRICDFDLIGGQGNYGAGSTFLFKLSYIALNSPDDNLYTTYELFLENEQLKEYIVKDETIPAGGALINGEVRTFYRRTVSVAYPSSLDFSSASLSLRNTYNAYNVPTNYVITATSSDYIRVHGDDDSSNVKLLVIGNQWEDQEYYVDSVRGVIDTFINDEPIIKNYAPSITIDAVKNNQVSCWSCKGSADGTEFCGTELLTVNDLTDAITWFGFRVVDILVRLGTVGITSLDELATNTWQNSDDVFFCEIDDVRSIADGGPKNYDHIIILSEYDQLSFDTSGEKPIISTTNFWRSHVGTVTNDASQNARCLIFYIDMGNDGTQSNCPNMDIIFQAVKNDLSDSKATCDSELGCQQRIDSERTGRTLIHEFGHSFSGIPDAYTHDAGCVDYRGSMCDSWLNYGNKDFFARDFIEIEYSEADVSVNIINYTLTDDAITAIIRVKNKNPQPVTSKIHLNIFNYGSYRKVFLNNYEEKEANITLPIIINSSYITLRTRISKLSINDKEVIDDNLIDNYDAIFISLTGEESYCYDGDGNNPFDNEGTYAKIVGNENFSGIMYWDVCNNETSLVERTCTNNDFTKELVTCVNGCLNDRCLPEKTPNYATGAYHMINEFNKQVGDLQSLAFQGVYPNPSNGHCSGAKVRASYKAGAKQPSFITMKIFNTAGRRVNEWASTAPIPFTYQGYSTPQLDLWIGNPSGHDPNDYIIAYGWPGSDVNNVQVAFDVYFYKVYQGNLEGSVSDPILQKFTFNNRNINYDTAYFCKNYFPSSTPPSSTTRSDTSNVNDVIIKEVTTTKTPKIAY